VQGVNDGAIDAAVHSRLVEGTGGGREVRVRADRAAHTLKSNAATFGAHGLAELSRSLEEAAKQGALAEGADGVEALARELEIVREALPAAWRQLSTKV
jgi:HPt (histidine-containing phosphotransfer) domain-containing protein